MRHKVTWWGRVVDAYSHAWDSRVPGFGVVVMQGLLYTMAFA